MSATDPKLAEEILSRNERMKAERQVWDGIWQELGEVVQPRKKSIQTKDTPDASNNADLYDTTAVDANLTLGAGQLNYITPASDRWANYEFPEPLRSRNGGVVPDDAAAWYTLCSEIAMREIARSNFYTEIHEFYLDRGGFGTACLWEEEGKRSLLNFKAQAVGTYCIGEDEEGYVDTVFREFVMTVRQAVLKFGVDALGEKMRKAYAEGGAKVEEKFTFVHAVYPRTDRDPKKVDPENKPFASVYVCKEDKTVVRNSGYDELPGFVTRYLLWGDNVYGYCPSIDICPTIRQVNFIERQMDALAEKAAFPPMLVPESMKGTIDPRAYGVTLFDPNQPNAMPREWMTQGRYDIGEARVESKKEAIRRAYHVDLFQMFAQAERQMTAYEAMQRVAEKLVLFTPTFMRLTTETLQPMLQRTFAILYRNGYFPEPPASVLVPTTEGVEIAVPQVVFTSKVALAIKALENRAFVEFIGIIGPLLQVRPDALDNFDVDEISRGLARNLSLPAKWLTPAKERDALRAQRAQAQQAQQGMMAMESMAKSAGAMGKAPAEMQEMAMGALNGKR